VTGALIIDYWKEAVFKFDIAGLFSVTPHWIAATMRRHLPSTDSFPRIKFV